MSTDIKQFEAGKTYQARSIGDSNCIWTVKIIKRTAKTLTMKVDGYSETIRKGIKVWDNEEACNFLGTHSMCPSIRAGRETL